MEPQTDFDCHEKPVATMDFLSKVDSSRPFRSVKEAVAIFGEKFLAGEIYSPKPFTFPRQETPYFSPTPQNLQEPSWKSSPSPQDSIYSNENSLVDTVKKLESELEETKTELNLLKERESETEVALASLNAELHKNMSKLAKAEADMAAKAATAAVASSRSAETSQSLAQILSIAEEKEKLFTGRKREGKVMKKKVKPIIPLVGDLFSRKKGSSTSMNNPLFASSHVQF
ncbi:WEB family protein At1g75720-like [Olea europaea var. sylvestris]|uniref:WEB family At3g51220 n=1 Tax=Olea europaea subsp. europaea TaxID=158383 RepID=A0A8S0PZT3_OLEEU|nr:WEB family protein At1g75720-like [Olea europaea var. sylvestris]CAA2960182.1 WEB family At3g51220 [Olea europaea subsp. europaea]